jgi:1-acyl-sn-glycerol-3-phosphate acyltransferase
MSAVTRVERYAAQQHVYTWRRHLLRGLIRTVGFGLLARVQVNGLENIPASGSTVLMMNHIGLADPVVCMGAVTHRFVIPMTKIENANHPIIGPFVWWWGAYTVDRTRADRKALQNSVALLKSGQLILIAPEGTRHPEGLAQPKDGLSYVATKAGAVIVPTAVTGTQHLTANLKRFKRTPMQVTFGRPFQFKTDGRQRIPRDELAQMTQEAMYQLALAQPDASLRGVYSDVEQATTDTLVFIDPTSGQPV